MPPENITRTNYNLRNREETYVPPTRLASFSRSFFPLATRVWNELPLETRSVNSCDEFKNKIHKGDETRILYCYGQRWPSIHHARMRIGCSKLNFDLHFNLHVIDNPTCTCGPLFEDAHHFFIECPHYLEIRRDLFNVISIFTQVSIDTILFGHVELTTEQNYIVFDAVHNYILKSKRFN